MTDLAALTAADFEGLEVAEFPRVVGADEPPVTLTLTEVRPGPPRQGTRSAFRLTFTGPLLITLDQGTHPLRHPELGDLELFLVPVGRNEVCMTYEAVLS